jgi:hypothetical protein
MSTKTIHKHGTIQAFNISPKGSYEGLLLQEKGGELVQINFGHEMAAVLSESGHVGDPISLDVEAEPAHGKPSHPVFRLVAMKGGNGNGGGHFSGTVARLNYALHGEVNGGILDTGDFLHLKPHGAAALDLKVGMNVSGLGKAKPMVGGHSVIEAEEVNGIRIEQKPKPKPKKKAAHH